MVYMKWCVHVITGDDKLNNFSSASEAEATSM